MSRNPLQLFTLTRNLLIGTTFAKFDNIGFSNAKTGAKLTVKLTSGSVGFGKIGTGQLNFSFGRHNGSFTAEKPNYYLETLDYAKQIHIILQDTGQRRAWQIRTHNHPYVQP
jgi:hypothetical protein